MATRDELLENLRRIMKKHFPHYIGQSDMELDSEQPRTWKVKLYYGIVPMTLTGVPEEYFLTASGETSLVALISRVLD